MLIDRIGHKSPIVNKPWAIEWCFIFIYYLLALLCCKRHQSELGVGYACMIEKGSHRAYFEYTKWNINIRVMYSWKTAHYNSTESTVLKATMEVTLTLICHSMNNGRSLRAFRKGAYKTWTCAIIIGVNDVYVASSRLLAFTIVQC